MTSFNRQATRNRALEDNLTTGLGLIAAVAGGLNQGGFYPRISGLVSVIAVALLGFFTNKPLTK
jgi:hypothetical protein